MSVDWERLRFIALSGLKRTNKNSSFIVASSFGTAVSP
jgi:hypothetical protein